ncbi:MAG: hypothetical protein JXE06_03580 [Coriobacteriia bacterium]|nr:hypothetical protein [Coriobacteriia bacterium]MBN2821667.1 hypothetical protein [Coriobacteriia bacterium]
MSRFRSKFVALVAATALLISMFAMAVPAAATEDSCVECEPCGEWMEYPLYAGQDWCIGTVLVNNCLDKVCVKYVLDPEVAADGWLLTEIHFSIGEEVANIPQTKKGNPIPGKFNVRDCFNPGVTETDPYCVDIEECWESDELFFAAHAVVKRMDCTVLAEAPYAGTSIESVAQGLCKDGSMVAAERSVPEAVLTWDTDKLPTDFFSLGFGGEIVIGFDCCIANGDGCDIRVVEDTWGVYPPETAEVFASMDGVNWTPLGEANNLTRDAMYDWQTVSEFDLGILPSAKYIKVVDTTDPAPLPANADGYDLNTVVALHNCVTCKMLCESAWVTWAGFAGKNWAGYATYTLQPCLVDTVLVYPTGDNPYMADEWWSNITLDSGRDYRLVASGTYRFANWGEYGIADAQFNYRDAAHAPGGIAGWYEQASARLQIWMDGAAVDWQPPTYNPEHIYTLEVAGADSPVAFTISDDQYSDNSGYLTVDIYALP